MIDVLENPYIKAAKVRGINPFRIIMQHAFSKNAFIPLLTKLGIYIWYFSRGTVIIESVFFHKRNWIFM